MHFLLSAVAIAMPGCYAYRLGNGAVVVQPSVSDLLETARLKLFPLKHWRQ
jgi:hypothetical protein